MRRPVPSPREDRPRPVPPVQLIARNRTGDRMSGPFRGRPVEIRNGLPEFRNPYVYRGAGHDILECTCHADAARHPGANPS